MEQIEPKLTHTLLNQELVNKQCMMHMEDPENFDCPECDMKHNGNQYKSIPLGDSGLGIVPLLLDLENEMYLEHITHDKVKELQFKHRVEK